MNKAFTYLCVLLSVSGCASSSKDVTATYVSPMQYNNYDCDQLVMEGQRLGARISQVGGRLDEAASNDKALATGAILLWPTLFFLGGTKNQEAEYSRLKGEYDATLQAATFKRCPGNGAPPPTVRPVEKAEK